MTDGDELEALLRRFQPRLRYDSQEAFFADSAEEWTDNPDNALRRSRPDGRRGELIASASPRAGEQQLALSFLGYPTYADGTAVERVEHGAGGDQIGADSRRDYRQMYLELRRTERYRNRMYGRAKEDSDGRLWLQYWFFYFYNDYNLAGGFGLHEGDWEMVQLRMGEVHPDLAVYAQHRQAQQASWDEVSTLAGSPDTPLVFVARGSHASYFRAGYHETEVWYDMADGKRETPPLTLEVIGDPEPAWLAWPGRWGDTRPRIADAEQPSPTAPCLHPQWKDPKALLRNALTFSLPGTAARAPDVGVRRAGGRLVLDLDFTTHTDPVERLVVTLNSRHDNVPPRTFTFALEQALRGRIETRLALAPTKYYEVHVSAIHPGGRPTESSLHPIGPVPPRPPLVHRVLLRLGRIVAAIRRLGARGASLTRARTRRR
ncbi:MAG: hypothetical protein M3296_10440 [Actinomycetota bacterium]|nr:hypothetical protein [Actinomycetota bacterium]